MLVRLWNRPEPPLLLRIRYGLETAILGDFLGTNCLSGTTCLHFRTYCAWRNDFKTAGLSLARASDFICTAQLANSATPSTRRTTTSSSSSRWKTRQTRDPFARSAKTSGLKSRAAFKLLELDQKHHLFSRGETVVDLGYAPGSWSQVAVSRTAPGGRVVGIDVIPAQPPRGASSIQGDFLSDEVRQEVRQYVRDEGMGRARTRNSLVRAEDEGEDGEERTGVTEEEVDQMGRGVLDSTIERANKDPDQDVRRPDADKEKKITRRQMDQEQGRVVDVVLSDMSEPWQPMGGMYVRSFSNPYYRMMNTSGMAFRDHAGSMVWSLILLLLLLLLQL